MGRNTLCKIGVKMATPVPTFLKPIIQSNLLLYSRCQNEVSFSLGFCGTFGGDGEDEEVSAAEGKEGDDGATQSGGGGGGAGETGRLTGAEDRGDFILVAATSMLERRVSDWCDSVLRASSWQRSTKLPLARGDGGSETVENAWPSALNWQLCGLLDLMLERGRESALCKELKLPDMCGCKLHIEAQPSVGRVDAAGR